MSSLPYHTPLGTDRLRALDIPAPWTFGLADRVRFAELDAIGHVNHTAYLRWFESFRLPFLAARHVTDYGPTSPRLVLKQVTCDYMAEMGVGEDYIVTGRTSAFRTTSFTMEFAVWRLGQAVEQTAGGRAIVVLLNRAHPGGIRYRRPDAGRLWQKTGPPRSCDARSTGLKSRQPPSPAPQDPGLRHPCPRRLEHRSGWAPTEPQVPCPIQHPIDQRS